MTMMVCDNDGPWQWWCVTMMVHDNDGVGQSWYVIILVHDNDDCLSIQDYLILHSLQCSSVQQAVCTVVQWSCTAEWRPKLLLPVSRDQYAWEDRGHSDIAISSRIAWQSDILSVISEWWQLFYCTDYSVILYCIKDKVILLYQR